MKAVRLSVEMTKRNPKRRAGDDRREQRGRTSADRIMYTDPQRDKDMIRTVEAVIDEQGNVRLLEPVHLPSARRALLTILEDRPATDTPEIALLSEAALGEDWNRPEEDEAWSHLSRVQWLRPAVVLADADGGDCIRVE